jgi:hypothetical protein
MHLAALPQHEPSLGMVRGLESLGAMNAERLQRYTSRGATP